MFEVTSPTLGTGGKRLWLLRSRPDQVDRPSMRGGPSRRILSPSAAKRDSYSYRVGKTVAAPVCSASASHRVDRLAPGYRPRTAHSNFS